MESNCGCDDERMLEGGGMSVVVGLLACVGLGSLDGSPTLMGTFMEVSSGIARCCWDQAPQVQWELDLKLQDPWYVLV